MVPKFISKEEISNIITTKTKYLYYIAFFHLEPTFLESETNGLHDHLSII